MTISRRSVLILLAAILIAGLPVLSAPPDDAGKAEQVEEHWPNGQLRLRKQILRLPDGTTVDHGTFERWHDNGKKEYEALFVDGMKQGKTIRYHKNGKKASEQQYSKGKRHGRSAGWNEAGELVKEEHWEEGRPHGTWTVWKHGEVKWTHRYDHGQP